MAFVHKDQGTILRGEAADLPQGRNVTIHGKGPISSYQAQSMFLNRRHRQVVAGISGQSLKLHQSTHVLCCLCPKSSPGPEEGTSVAPGAAGTSTPSFRPL